MQKDIFSKPHSQRILLFTLLAVLVAVLVPSFLANTANAADARSFKAGRIIDDNIFTNSDSMNVGDIQRFLDSKVTCDNYGTKRSELGGGTRAQWLSSRGISTPITCLNQFYENPQNRENNYGKSIPTGAISAAQIIYNYSKQFNINPQVIIVTLQKENGLVTDEWPTPTQYNSALGFGCPDTITPGAPACDPQYKSFSTQVYQAARHFRGYMDRQYCDFAGRGWCTPYVVGSNNIQVQDPRVRNCGRVAINIENRATSALYSYTPYVPNQAALNAQYGSGDGCSAYGNRNFYLYFTDWFGSTLGPAHAWEEVSKKAYTDATKINQIDLGSIETNQYFYIDYTIRNTGSVIWKKDSVLLGKSNSQGSPFCTAEWLSCARPATITSAEVKPGETTTIGFWMRAPTAPGTYKEYYNLVIENYTWFADIGSHYSITVKQKTETKSSLSSGANRILKRGDSIQSPNGRSVFNLSPSGELAIYHDTKKVWNAEKGGVNDVVLQTDGNLVAYTSTGDVAWVVIGNNNCGALSILDSGVLEYKCGNSVLWNYSWDITSTASNGLPTNNLLFSGQTIKSTNNSYTLSLQHDGNLVLYDNKGQGVWGSNTNAGAFLVQQSDGNLVLYDNKGQGVWGSSRSGTGSPIITYVQDDGNIVTYTPSRAIWGSKK